MSTAEPAAPPLLAAQDLVRHHRLPRRRLLEPAPLLKALDGVSLTMTAGRNLGVVGASGSGKSTLARLVMALEPPTAGGVLLEGHDLHRLPPEALRRARARMQMVFQDPYGSLDPRRSVLQTVSEPLALLRGAGAAERRERAVAVLAAVGLARADLDKRPHEFSGGQRQRIAIARALVTRPRLIVADEPVSALDVSVQAQVLNLMQDLQDSHGVTYLLISHDLAVVAQLCDEVVVLDAGRIVEAGPPARLFGAPQHAVTRRLVAAATGARVDRAPAAPVAAQNAGAGPEAPPEPTAMSRATIERLYAAFSRLDGAAMQACYAPDARFEDEVFALAGRREVGGMWRMLCAATKAQGAAHWRLEVGTVGDRSAHWEAHYVFSATGRRVHNRIDAEFEFDADGLIVRHRDRFDFWAWSRQALGLPGLLLGWTPMLRNKLRAQAAAKLERFLGSTG